MVLWANRSVASIVRTMLDVTRLRVLVAVARHGSVTAAAHALNYAQPSVRHHLGGAPGGAPPPVGRGGSPPPGAPAAPADDAPAASADHDDLRELVLLSEPVHL